MTKWSEGLKSGDYNQGTCVLKGPSGYCCLGVLEDMAGVQWKDVYDDGTAFRDEFGHDGLLSYVFAKAANLELQITDEERRKINAVLNKFGMKGYTFDAYPTLGRSRQRSLSALNDDQVPFDIIAKVIEAVGWDVDVEGLRDKAKKEYADA